MSDITYDFLDWKACEATWRHQLRKELGALLSLLHGSNVFIMEEHLEAMVRSESTFILVAYDGKSAIGMGSLTFVPTLGGPEAHLGSIAVLKQYRGRGVGSTVLHRLMEKVAEKGVKDMRSTARAFDEETQKLFGRFDFGERTVVEFVAYSE